MYVSRWLFQLTFGAFLLLSSHASSESSSSPPPIDTSLCTDAVAPAGTKSVSAWFRGTTGEYFLHPIFIRIQFSPPGYNTRTVVVNSRQVPPLRRRVTEIQKDYDSRPEVTSVCAVVGQLPPPVNHKNLTKLVDEINASGTSKPTVAVDYLSSALATVRFTVRTTSYDIVVNAQMTRGTAWPSALDTAVAQTLDVKTRGSAHGLTLALPRAAFTPQPVLETCSATADSSAFEYRDEIAFDRFDPQVEVDKNNLDHFEHFLRMLNGRALFLKMVLSELALNKVHDPLADVYALSSSPVAVCLSLQPSVDSTVRSSVDWYLMWLSADLSYNFWGHYVYQHPEYRPDKTLRRPGSHSWDVRFRSMVADSNGVYYDNRILVFERWPAYPRTELGDDFKDSLRNFLTGTSVTLRHFAGSEALNRIGYIQGRLASRLPVDPARIEKVRLLPDSSYVDLRVSQTVSFTLEVEYADGRRVPVTSENMSQFGSIRARAGRTGAVSLEDKDGNPTTIDVEAIGAGGRVGLDVWLGDIIAHAELYVWCDQNILRDRSCRSL